MSYITNPPCSPSRCSLMTGMYAQRFGKSGMARGLPIPDDHPTMAEFMRDAGYVTGQVGKWDIGSVGQGPHQRGFMEVARNAPGDQYNRRLRMAVRFTSRILTAITWPNLLTVMPTVRSFFTSRRSPFIQKSKTRHSITAIGFREETGQPMKARW